MLENLDRPTALGEISAWPSDGVLPSLAERSAGFAYRGPGLLAEEVLGPASAPIVTGRMTYDPARRLLSTVYEDVSSNTVYSESLTWTPRSLKASQTRQDLNDLVASFTYDGAQRLTAAERPARETTDLPEAWTFTYDEAQNLLAKTETTGSGADAVSTAIELPLDGSGRNRPGSVDGVALTYDAAGNLTAKGDRTFHWDWSNRLIRAADAGGTVGTYTYDAFSRRVRREVAGEVHDTVWAGWQAVEEYVDGTLSERRTFGLGLDEMVLVERDSDGNGTLDQRYRPLYDSIGNVAEILSESGQVIERYSYSPYGQRTITVNDLTPPEVQQVRVVGDEVWIELSESVSAADLAEAVSAGLITLEETASSTAVPFTWALPVSEGPLANRRLVLTPDTPPAGGTEVRLVLAAGALEDLFGNATTTATDQTFAWIDGVVNDTAAPTLEQVSVDSTGRVRVDLSEPVDPATVAAALVVDGGTNTWTAEADGYTWRSETALPVGSHTLRVETTLADLAGLTLAQPWEETFTVNALMPQRLVYSAPDPSAVTSSTAGNLYGFHGRLVDPETGLLYFRHRYFDAETGRFVSADPLVYVDGPSLYTYASNSPSNKSDPMGLCPQCEAQAELREFQEWVATLPPEERAQEMEALRAGQAQATSLTVGFIPVAGEVHDVSQVVTGTDILTGEDLSTEERVLVGAGIALPFVGGKALRWLARTPVGQWAAEAGGRAGRYVAVRWADFHVRLGAADVPRGVPEGARYAQRTFGAAFSDEGLFAGRTVDDVAAALRSGELGSGQVPINYIVRDGNTLILNTRSAQAIEAAGIPRSQWNAINQTGNQFFEDLLTGQLQRYRLTSEGTATVRRTGG